MRECICSGPRAWTLAYRFGNVNSPPERVDFPQQIHGYEIQLKGRSGCSALLKMSSFIYAASPIRGDRYQGDGELEDL